MSGISLELRPVTHTSGLRTRLSRLLVGLVGFGVSLGLMVRAGLGLGPWDVLHQGLASAVGVQIGFVVIAMSALVLLTWIPLHQRPGVGTVINLMLVGLVVNATLDVVPTPLTILPRVALLAGGIAVNAVSTALYIGAGLGPGPRDGLMVGLAARGYPIRRVRTSIELGALALGWACGGSIGIGTVAYAVLIGPAVHFLLPPLTFVATQGARS